MEGDEEAEVAGLQRRLSTSGDRASVLDQDLQITPENSEPEEDEVTSDEDHHHVLMTRASMVQAPEVITFLRGLLGRNAHLYWEVSSQRQLFVAHPPAMA